MHPSLLPDLKGPAPIQHAILRGRQHTGVSVQTLHPSQFDGGVVLAQTRAPGIEIAKDVDGDSLTEKLGYEGAEMLVEVLKKRAFVPPLKDVGWYGGSGGPVDHAGKIRKGDQEVNFLSSSLERVFAVKKAIGDPWCTLPNGERLILNEFSVADGSFEQTPGSIWTAQVSPKEEALLARMACGGIMKIDKSSISGRPVGGGNQRVISMLKAQQKCGNTS